MRLLPILTAALVTATLYLLVFERDALLAIAQVERTAEGAAAEAAEAKDLVRVVALRSAAEIVDSAVVLRGQTEADREVEVRAETSGKVISEPLRKGAFVEEGDLLCRLDPGTRQSMLEEAQGRLQEARARLPEAQASVPSAEARRAEADARLAEAQSALASAKARLAEAEINQRAAERLGQDGFASETRVANAQAALESARAGITSAEAAVESARAGIIAAEAGIEGAEATVQSARAGIQSAQAAVAAAERELERLTIEAPFAGLLETDSAELGALLQPGSPCATVIQLDPIKLVGFVPEADVNRIEVGAMAGARLASGQQVRGQVTFLSRAADPTTRTFRVEVQVPNPDLAIRDGQTAEILVATDGQEAHLIPQSALTLDDEGVLGVRTVEEGDITGFVPVEVIRDATDGIWVRGLPQEVAVIVVGQEYVTEGVRVIPSYREEADG